LNKHKLFFQLFLYLTSRFVFIISFLRKTLKINFFDETVKNFINPAAKIAYLNKDIYLYEILINEQNKC